MRHDVSFFSVSDCICMFVCEVTEVLLFLVFFSDYIKIPTKAT